MDDNNARKSETIDPNTLALYIDSSRIDPGVTAGLDNYGNPLTSDGGYSFKLSDYTKNGNPAQQRTIYGPDSSFTFLYSVKEGENTVGYSVGIREPYDAISGATSPTQSRSDNENKVFSPYSQIEIMIEGASDYDPSKPQLLDLSLLPSSMLEAIVNQFKGLKDINQKGVLEMIAYGNEYDNDYLPYGLNNIDSNEAQTRLMDNKDPLSPVLARFRYDPDTIDEYVEMDIPDADGNVVIIDPREFAANQAYMKNMQVTFNGKHSTDQGPFQFEKYVDKLKQETSHIDHGMLDQKMHADQIKLNLDITKKMHDYDENERV
jgi:hypothetical protein